MYVFVFQSCATYMEINIWIAAIHFSMPCGCSNTHTFSRTVYHCPFCNLCRLGKGLGVDFFHCMKCNCCLGMKLTEHKCREKGLETNCPICCDFLFTSSAAVRALPCGHFMHSACFQVRYLGDHDTICSPVRDF
jgi:hypothetical protein